MFGDIDILTKTSAMARHAAKKHAVIAENIANANTPAYRAQKLPSFDPNQAMEAAEKGAHISSTSMMRPSDNLLAEAKPNGNTVSLEEQMADSANAQAQHETALAFYKKAIDLLRLSYSDTR